MYRPGKLHQRMPKLVRGAMTAHRLLDLAWRQGAGQSQRAHVEPYMAGVIHVDVPSMGGMSGVALTVEISRDTQRWGDILHQAYYAAGYYTLQVENFDAYLRVSYQIQGSVQLGLEFVGKSFLLGEPPRALLCE